MFKVHLKLEKFQGKKAIHPVYCTGNMADSVEVRRKSKKKAPPAHTI